MYNPHQHQHQHHHPPQQPRPPSSASSSSSLGAGSIPIGPPRGSGQLIRYGSAPGSLLSNTVDSLITCDLSALGGSHPLSHYHHHHHRYFSAAGETTSSSSATASESTTSSCIIKPPSAANNCNSYCLNEIAGNFAASSSATTNNLFTKTGGAGAGSLVRHSSSPAGLLNHLLPPNTTTADTTTSPAAENVFSVARGIGSYNSKGVSDSGHGLSRLSSQLSFTRQESLSHISEESENVAEDMSAENGHRKAAHFYATAGTGMSSWSDTNSIVFSAPSSKRAKNITDDVVHSLDTVESQFQFGLPQTALEMASMDKLLQIPQDSVPCKIRAKRGCATHPRSIAERERRTRISGKLKKLQDLVPNMDKQTSYADMLDLAVQHIKGLQNQVQKLHKELENCTCGCMQTKED